MKTENLSRALSTHAFFGLLPTEYSAWLGSCATNVRLGATEFLFRQGDAADRVYLVRTGQLLMQASGNRGYVLLPGDALGWQGLMGTPTRTADCRAESSTLLFSLETRCLERKMVADSQFGFHLARALLLNTQAQLERG